MTLVNKSLFRSLVLAIHSLIVLAISTSQFAIATPSAIDHFYQQLLTSNTEEIRGLKGKAFEFRDHRSVEFAETYLKVQNLIASLIPHEYDRPIFNIVLSSPNDKNQAKTIGLLGGMGPRSDAHFLLRLLKTQSISQARSLKIHLLSIPPPRQFKEIVQGGWRYGWQLNNFFGLNYSKFYLLSNSAHTNFTWLSLLDRQDKLVHLPQLLVSKLATNERTLILGTNQTRKSRLYERLFDENNLPYISISQLEQNQVQGYIDLIKRKPLGMESRIKIIGFFKSLLEKYASRTIFLACTEFSLGLDEELKKFEKNFIVHDSEEIFVRLIVNDLEPQPSKQPL